MRETSDSGSTPCLAEDRGRHALAVLEERREQVGGSIVWRPARVA